MHLLEGGAVSEAMKARGTTGRVWLYRPELHWFGWMTLAPVMFGGDEYGRRTVVLGWNLLGQVVIAYGKARP